MDSLRTPWFIAAVCLAVLVIVVEIGAAVAIPQPGYDSQKLEERIDDPELADALDEIGPGELERLADDKPPGLAIPYMALLDGVLLFTVVLMGGGLLVKERIQGRIQGVVTLVFSCILILCAFLLAFAALAKVMVMVSLLLAPPFGTIAYIAKYGFFNKTGANLALGLTMVLKLGFVVCLVLAQQRFLENKGMIVLVLVSFLNLIIVSFLHNFFPTFLVSITDGIAAIIGAVLGVIFALVLLIGSLNATIKALRVDRA